MPGPGLSKRLITIHSQKGGVGKTTIALYLARRSAGPLPPKGVKGDQETVLIDADLTGTSLSDVLELASPNEDCSAFRSHENTLGTLRKWAREMHDDADRTFHVWPNSYSGGLRLLNDVLFCNPWKFAHAWDQDGLTSGNDLHLSQLLWRWAPSEATEDTLDELAKLRVIPSSAIPGHVAACVPHIYKEDVTSYLLTRLKEFVWRLWNREKDSFHTIIIDTPPVLQGMSKAVFKLHDELHEMAEQHKDPLGIDHRAVFVCGPDIQDITASAKAVDALFSERAQELKLAGKSYSSALPWTSYVVNRLMRYRSGQATSTSERQYPLEVALDGRVFIFDKNDKVEEYYGRHLRKRYVFQSKELKPSNKSKRLFGDDAQTLLVDYEATRALGFVAHEFAFGAVPALDRLLQ